MRLNVDPLRDGFREPLDTVVLVAAAPLPREASGWPVRAVEAAVLTGEERYVLCGPQEAVRALLASHPSPLYVVTDSAAAQLPAGPHASVRNFAAPSVAAGEWEEAVATVCSLHLSTVPEMVLQHARRCPDAAALHDGGADVSYAHLCGAAWALGDLLSSRGVDLSSGGRVGVLLPPSLLLVVSHLGLGMRGLAPCVLSPFAPLRRYQLSRVKCRAILVGSADSIDTDEQQPQPPPPESLSAGAEAAAPFVIDLAALPLPPFLSPCEITARLPAPEAEFVFVSPNWRPRGPPVFRCIHPRSAVFTGVLSVVFTRCSEDAAHYRLPPPSCRRIQHVGSPWTEATTG